MKGVNPRLQFYDEEANSYTFVSKRKVVTPAAHNCDVKSHLGSPVVRLGASAIYKERLGSLKQPSIEWKRCDSPSAGAFRRHRRRVGAKVRVAASVF
eukprot:COSAG06_NODE_313_length_17764_cov_4.287235_9_plen_97_part_00